MRRQRQTRAISRALFLTRFHVVGSAQCIFALFDTCHYTIFQILLSQFLIIPNFKSLKPSNQNRHNYTKHIRELNQKLAVISAGSVSAILEIGIAKSENGTATFHFGTDTSALWQ